MPKHLPMILFLSCFAACALAQEGAWNPPAPPENGKDWIRLNSGEWLTGEIEDNTLEFESDDLGLDRGDIAEVRCPHVCTYHTAATISVELTNLLDLDVSFVWDRVESPRRDDGGNIPVRDDARLAIGLGIDW